MASTELQICERLEGLRVELFGSRGKSEMARRLDIRPSTYDRYERDRVPPADLLVKIAEVADVTLEWLITGDGPRRPDRDADVEAEMLTRQFKELLVAQPSFRPVASSLLKWAELATQPGDVDPAEIVKPKPDYRLPVLGATGSSMHAIVPQRLSRDLSNERWLAEMVGTMQASSSDDVRLIDEATGTFVGDGVLESYAHESGLSVETLRVPARCELSRPIHWDDAFAVRVDDNSMAPAAAKGTWVIAAPLVTASDGHTCVVKRAGSDRLEVRNVHRDLSDVLLVPLDSRLDVRRLPHGDLQFTFPVVGLAEPVS